MLRLKPSASASAPKATPAAMPATCTVDNKKPDSSSDSPSADCRAVMAGGSFATCSAALTPARMTTAAARSCAAAAAVISRL